MVKTNIAQFFTLIPTVYSMPIDQGDAWNPNPNPNPNKNFLGLPKPNFNF